MAIDQVDHITYVFHSHEFTQLKFDLEVRLHGGDELDMAHRIPVLYVLGACFPGDSNVFLAENYLENGS